MFTKQELQVIAQALSMAQVQVGQAKEAIELLDKVIKEIDKPARK